jgi:hypothetical protein
MLIVKNKIMKSIIYVFCLCFLFSCSSKSDENFEDLKKIKPKMSFIEVRKIMRNKESSVENAYYDDKLLIVRYDSGMGASDDFKIILSKKDSLVISIEFGD